MGNKAIDLEYYRNLPKKRMAATALILNADDEILIVKPSYKDHWLVPGGVVEKDESPKEACLREAKEEIGLELNDNDIRFLCVDYTSDKDGKGESLQFVFSGGKLSENEMQNIELDGKEIVDHRFVNIDDALLLLSEKLGKRLARSIDALKDNTVIYLENGERF